MSYASYDMFLLKRAHFASDTNFFIDLYHPRMYYQFGNLEFTTSWYKGTYQVGY